MCDCTTLGRIEFWILALDSFLVLVSGVGFGQGAGSKRVLVFDLGGRGLDVTLVDVLGSSVQISATAREDGLGGEAFDAAFIEYIAKEFQDKVCTALTRIQIAMIIVAIFDFDSEFRFMY